ncbi:MAG: exodeoxyribonuclease V subunit gamma [Verrucomicrobia bacterium]|nr:exodeoxyribonuclease V subunit gamma [Verrucomicrobiota bacterium]
MKPLVVVSNSLDQLLDRLKANIAASGNNPFYKIEILLSDPHSKTALELQLAEQCKTTFGLTVTSLEAFVKTATNKTILDFFVLSGFDLQLASESAKSAWYESPLELHDLPDEIHLFAFSALPSNVNELFFSISNKVKLFYYVLSPCLYFWSDICTDKEAKRLTKRLKANQEYVYDRSKLLANLGTSSRAFMAYLEEHLDDFQEEYVVKQAAADRSEAVYKIVPGDSTTFDLLLNDLLLSGSGEKCVVNDNTVQLHKAPTVMREVEILYQHIKEMKGRIIVYAPDIELYRSYIESLFSGQVEIVAKKRGVLLPLLIDILSMPYKQLQPKSIFELFQSRSFRKKCGLEGEDLSILSTALQKFGDDFTQTVVQMWTVSGEIGSTEAELLGKCLELIEKIKISPKCTTLREWQKHFITTLESFFDPVAEDREEFYLIKRAALLACKTDRENVDQKQALATLKVALNELETKKECTGSSQILFASLGELRSLPRDTVCFLGMQEGVYLDQEDRHAILEAIFTTKSMLYISYLSYAFKERISLQPNGIVLDILEVVPVKPVEHPLESCGEKERPAHLLPKSAFENASRPLAKILYVHELNQVAKYPLRAYLQRTLGLYLRENKPKLRSSEFELLNPQMMGALRKKALISSGAYAELAPLPEQVRNAATAILDEDVELLAENARSLALELNRPIDKMAPLSIGNCTIAGSIANLYPQGIVVFEKKSKDALYRIWPELLLLNIISDAPKVIFLKDAEVQQVAIENPRQRLKEYLDYVHHCHNSPSIFYPEWIELLKKEHVPPEKCYEPSFMWRDPYLDFYLSRISKEEFALQWQRSRESAVSLFSLD